MYYRLKNKIILFVALLLLLSCNRLEYFTPRNFDADETIVLAHGASGNSTEYRRNTLDAAIYGFSCLDGIEVDVSISKDYGLWLTHDSEVKSTDKSFINVLDSEIASVKDDDGNPYYDRLEDVLIYMSENEHTKYISLDVKYPSEVFSGSTFTSVAEQISSLVFQYNLQNRLCVESNSLSFLKKVEDLNPNIESYYLCWGNYEKGIGEVYQNNLTGISFDYKRNGGDELISESIELAHELGIKVIVYTINDENINPVYSLGVDIIETDELDFYEQLNSTN